MRAEFNPYYTVRRDSTAGREHPWTAGEFNPDFKYYDFRKNPALIETSLEDFRPLADYAAVQTFYTFLRFVNGADSTLETNDCALRLADNKHDDNGFKRRAFGRVLMLVRELIYNTSNEAVNYYLHYLTQELINSDRDFQAGAILVTKFPTLFTEIPKEPEHQTGYCGEILFWAWGNDDAETMRNLDRVFKNLDQAVKKVSEHIAASLASQKK